MSVGENLTKDERPPYINFEKRAIENKVETLKQGHYVGKDVDYVYVTLPGGRDVYASKVDVWLEKQTTYARNGRIKQEWLDYYIKSYRQWQQGEEIPENGTPIKTWSALSPNQIQIILGARIRTVEDLAQANDEGLRRLGMGGRDLVNKAKSWLNSANDTGKIALQNAALEKENEHLKTTVSSLEEKVEILIRKVEAMDRSSKGAVETISASDFIPEPEVSEIDQLRQMHLERFGKRAHPASKIETLRKKLGV